MDSASSTCFAMFPPRGTRRSPLSSAASGGRELQSRLNSSTLSSVCWAALGLGRNKRRLPIKANAHASVRGSHPEPRHRGFLLREEARARATVQFTNRDVPIGDFHVPV